ncbi:MAG: aminotransferase class I/II-fold pyridoxal phosphate-dependent enzyme [Polyangiaceae bacterium]
MKQSTPPGLTFLDGALSDAKRQDLLRERPPPRTHDPAVSFCSNDYLALAGRRAPSAASGAAASRLVSGDDPIHASLEEAAAELVGQAASLVFTSGYAANVGLLSALAGPGDLIVSDSLNHASIIDGARLSRAKIAVVPHLELDSVARALRERMHCRAFVVTESYFSMDADSPNLPALRSLCNEHGAALVVDEAHALGVLGSEGRGLCAEAGVRADAVVGTFGKAFGAGGAFVAGCPALVAWLWNRARSFVFSTGLSPVVAAAALEGMHRARQEPWRREQVIEMAGRLRSELGALDAEIRGFGHILPWVVGDAGDAMDLARRLRERGADVRAIRPPSVPPGTARLRLTVTAGHREADVQRIVDAVKAVRRTSRGELRPKPKENPQRRGRLVVVTGTGTGIGKTHFAEALLRRWGRSARVAGVKPIESGVDGRSLSDAQRLAAASTFHVKQMGYAFPAPLSPHLAARDQGTAIRLEVVLNSIAQARELAEGVVLELPGGLFTPVDDSTSNADLATMLAPDLVLLVAPDRLGVLHDVTAAIRAAASIALPIGGIVLVAPESRDSSTGRNAPELRRLSPVPVLATLPRGTPLELADMPGLWDFLDVQAKPLQETP